ncbi:hypothetical protein HEQ62_09635 [Haematospirillum jordaniae]|uniref:Permease n=1 Tax=Haematospirillum jordaniae TaxID=1549855 RepID=A0A143DGJ9_9PROT|nr:hypothetical protein [Haematospirillum jordaniae]AMW35894.1 hypothetical protein AY555_11040 [Haematospirillum jordaniae]NKD57972.1 hypothetical protein [Haematospirillum jordaniae]NKD60031.1 hypothetical protein [Haematospirillum jordaniae]NKD67941.1 hypothetical protein [Haematospirillum jordaniae]NKD80034.1 hypothetical protein [Haematospirillum jordaniae]
MKVIFSVGSFLLQFFPLTVFLKVAFLNGKHQAADWLNAFIWGGSAAILQLALSIFFSRGHPLNRIILGFNWYLIIGGFAVIANQFPFLEFLNNLKETGIFLCLLIVGIYTTFASKAGFVGAVKISMQRNISNYSIWLIILTCAAVAVSFWFRGQTIISSAVPLIVLSVATRLFKRRLQRGRDELALTHDGR